MYRCPTGSRTMSDSTPRAVPDTTAVETRRLFHGAVRLCRLPQHTDARGALLPLEFHALPLVPRRAFLVHGVPAGTSRGGHAHACGQQLFVCLAGEVIVELEFRGEAEHVRLSRPIDALLVDAGVWARQTYLDDAVLLVFASEPYDADDYCQHVPV